MALTVAQYQALKTELNGDPNTYGYATFRTSGNDAALRLMLNHVRDGSSVPQMLMGEPGVLTNLGVAGAAITVRRPDISTQAVWEAINMADMATLSGSPSAANLSNERKQLAWLSGLPAIGTLRLENDDGSSTQVQTNLQAIFPAGSGTRTRLVALATRQGSRAEQLFGTGTVLTDEDIGIALRQT